VGFDAEELNGFSRVRDSSGLEIPPPGGRHRNRKITASLLAEAGRTSIFTGFSRQKMAIKRA
jgi:hypothetical protein